jgi:hypothetical protein
MAKPRALYLLIALLLWAQFDDAWVSDPILTSSAAAAGDDDEYLPSERQQSERSASHQIPAYARVNHQTVDFFSIRQGPTTGSELAVAFGPSQLYVFMSLQC